MTDQAMSEDYAPDTSNRFLVGAYGNGVRIMLPIGEMSKDEALNLAAWLVAVADADDRFSGLLDAVRNT